MIKDSGERTKFDTGAVRDMHTGKGRMDLLPLSALIELSKHCEEGALKYGEHNVDKGIPQHSLCDSAMRHLVKYMRGDTDEPHLRAAAWNLMWALNQTVEHPELVDVPWRNGCEVGENFNNLQRRLESSKWILPDDRTPKNGSYVLVSFENFERPDIGRYEGNDEGGQFYIGYGNYPCKSYGLIVNAWMPLPEPYKGVDDDEK